MPHPQNPQEHLLIPPQTHLPLLPLHQASKQRTKFIHNVLTDIFASYNAYVPHIVQKIQPEDNTEEEKWIELMNEMKSVKKHVHFKERHGYNIYHIKTYELDTNEADAYRIPFQYFDDLHETVYMINFHNFSDVNEYGCYIREGNIDLRQYMMNVLFKDLYKHVNNNNPLPILMLPQQDSIETQFRLYYGAQSYKKQMKKGSLMKMAKLLNIKGRTKMNKYELFSHVFQIDVKKQYFKKDLNYKLKEYFNEE